MEKLVELKFTERELATIRMGLGAIGMLAREHPDRRHLAHEETLANRVLGRILDAEDYFFPTK